MKQVKTVAVACLLFTGAPVWGGVTLVFEGKPEQMVMVLDGNKMRVEQTSEHGNRTSTMIFDGDKDKVIGLDPMKRTYFECRVADMSARAKSQMERFTSKMTEEQRKAMEEQLRSPPNMKWEPTGKTQKVAGFSCEWFREVLPKGGTLAHVCFIPWSPSVVTQADTAPMRKMEQFLSRAEWPITGADIHAIYAKFTDSPGLPAITEYRSPAGKVDYKLALSRLERGSVAPEKFQPPAGYTRSEIPSN